MNMKKMVCKVISVIMCVICIYAIVMCVKVINEPVRGFLDFRDLAFAIFGGVGLLSGIVAFFIGKKGWNSKSKE